MIPPYVDSFLRLNRIPLKAFVHLLLLFSTASKCASRCIYYAQFYCLHMSSLFIGFSVVLDKWNLFYVVLFNDWHTFLSSLMKSLFMPNTYFWSTYCCYEANLDRIWKPVSFELILGVSFLKCYWLLKLLFKVNWSSFKFEWWVATMENNIVKNVVVKEQPCKKQECFGVKTQVDLVRLIFFSQLD